MECQEPDYVPLSFMIFTALQRKCKDQFEFGEKQLELGLDAVVDCHELPVRPAPQVTVRVWQGETDNRSPLLYKEYQTPDGALRTIVRRTADWPHGERIPLFDD